MPDSMHHPEHRRSAILLAIGVLIVHTALRVAVILGPGMGGPSAQDEHRFHIPVIERFGEQWPAPDVSEYHAAATPAHHLVLAFIESIASPSLETLRVLSGLPVSLHIALLAWWCARRVGVVGAVALTLPLTFSPHVVAFSTLVLPESSSWLLVGALLMLACAKRFETAACVMGGALLLASVGVRQLTLWCAAPLWVAAWLGAAPLLHNPARVVPATVWPIDQPKARLVRSVICLACTLPAFGLIAWFVWLWGGLVPPVFQSAEAALAIDGAVVNQGRSPASGAFVLSILGLAGLAFTPLVIRPLLERRSLVTRWALLGGAVGLLAALIPLTSYDMESGRWGGLWKGVRLAPVFADRSVFIAALSTLGGAMTGVLVLALPPTRVRWVLLSALGAAIVAHAMGAQLFQRYIEPLLLIVLPIAVAATFEEREDRPPLWTLVMPCGLALALLALTVQRIGA